MVIKRILLGLIAILAMTSCGAAPMYPTSAYAPNPYNNPYAAQQNGFMTANNGFYGGTENTGAYDNGYGSGTYGDPNAYNTTSGYGTSAYPQPSAQPSGVPQAIPTQTAPPQPNSGKGQLHVLTYNVWGLPGPLSTHRKERFERLGESLKGYDVVTLQETFSDDIEILNQTTDFAYHARHNNDGLIRYGSGLYTLSKYPILKTEFRQFKSCTTADCLARKGVLLTRIKHPTIGPVDIYTTHYQAEQKAASEKIRIQEDNRVLQEFIQEVNSPHPVIITGDFNFLPEKSEYNNLMQRLPVVDVFKSLYPNDPGYTSHPDNPYKKGVVAQRLDYIFTLKNDVRYTITPKDVRIGHDRAVQDFILSDHYSVAAKLEFNVKNPVLE